MRSVPVLFLRRRVQMNCAVKFNKLIISHCLKFVNTKFRINIEILQKMRYNLNCKKSRSRKG